MQLEETVVLKAECVIVTNSYVQLSAPCPSVVVPIAHVVSVEMVAFGVSARRRFRRGAQVALALLGAGLLASGIKPIGVIGLLSAVVWFLVDSRRRWVIAIRDSSGASYEIPFTDPDAGIRFFGEFQNHWTISCAPNWQSSMKYGPLLGE